MKLPTGITGFGPAAPDYGDNQIFGLMVAFYGENWKLLKTRPSEMARSYYCFDLSIERDYVSETLSILVHKTHPYFCAIKTPEDHEVQFVFIEVPDSIASHIPETFYICTPEELAKPPVGDVLSALTKDEIRQITYWEPKRIGDVIFNWFD